MIHFLDRGDQRLQHKENWKNTGIDLHLRQDAVLHRVVGLAEWD